VRLFLAVDIPDETRAAAFAWTDTWRGRDDGWRWVAPAAVHATLRFYGDTPEATAAELRTRIAALAAAGRASVLRVAGWGVFPGPGRPRVLWAGIDGDLAPLRELAAAPRRTRGRSGSPPRSAPSSRT